MITIKINLDFVRYGIRDVLSTASNDGTERDVTGIDGAMGVDGNGDGILSCR
jgi:hypothetical protein